MQIATQQLVAKDSFLKDHPHATNHDWRQHPMILDPLLSIISNGCGWFPDPKVSYDRINNFIRSMEYTSSNKTNTFFKRPPQNLKFSIEL